MLPVLPLYGGLILYLVLLAALMGIRFWREESKHRAEVRQYWRELRAVPYVDGRSEDTRSERVLDGRAAEKPGVH